MPLASTMHHDTSNRSIQAVRNARSLGTLPPLVGNRGNTTSLDTTSLTPNQEDDPTQDVPDDPALDTVDTLATLDTHNDHVPDSFFADDALGTTDPVKVPPDPTQEHNMIFFNVDGLPTKNDKIKQKDDVEEEEDYTTVSVMAQFETAPRRQHLYALMDLSHEAHRERLHTSWSLIKNAFRARPPQGVRVEPDLRIMLREECQVTLSDDQLTSLMRQLPSELRQPHACMSYYEFLEFFGALQPDGTVVEPRVEQHQNPGNQGNQGNQGKNSTTNGTTNGTTQNASDDGWATPPGQNSTTASLEEEGKRGRLDVPVPPHHEEATEEAAEEAAKHASTATRFSTRVATEWDAYKAENNIDTVESNQPNDQDDDQDDAISHHIDLSLEEVRSLSATCIQSATRGMLARKSTRLRRALALCMRHSEAILRTIVRVWAEYTRARWKVRVTCRRPLHRWLRYIRRLRQHRLTFRVCYWSFYVWRRTTNALVYSRHKVCNLLDIYRTSVVLHCFRVWKKWYVERKQHKELDQQRTHHMNAFKIRQVLGHWHPWAAKRSQLLKNWREKGSHLAAQNHLARRLTWFAMWKYLTYLSAVVKERSVLYWLFEDKPVRPWHEVDNNGVVDSLAHGRWLVGWLVGWLVDGGRWSQLIVCIVFLVGLIDFGFICLFCLCC